MNDVTIPRDEIEQIVARGSISAEDVESVRATLFRDGVNDRGPCWYRPDQAKTSTPRPPGR